MATMTPSEYYSTQCENHHLSKDAQQLSILSHFDTLYYQLIKKQIKKNKLLPTWRSYNHTKGIYLWGSVGTGKTLLMDCFYHCLPFQNKIRIHFHDFMRFIHHELKLYQGKKDPLKLIANQFIKNKFVLCFDELLVSDIVDAMLIGRLFPFLFQQGVCIVATSNTAPDHLYHRGLQRQQFLPAIETIKTQMKILHINSSTDYRFKYLKSTVTFFTPNNSIAHAEMEKIFSILTTSNIHFSPITINDRKISIIKESDKIIWFEFKDLCSPPRSQNDYLVLSEKYHTIFISNITKIYSDENNVIALFIKLIDVFYDKRIRLILSSEISIENIYTEGRFLSEFIRTKSRLFEMQSEEYLRKKY